MNHLVVTRVAIGIAVLCLVAALGFAALRSEPPSQEGRSESTPAPESAPAKEHPGAALFGTYCGNCHAPEHLVGPLRGPEPQKARQEMLAFLRKHGKSDDAQDQLIVDYLAQSVTPEK